MIIILRLFPNHQNLLLWKIILNTLRREVLKLKTTRLVFDLNRYLHKNSRIKMWLSFEKKSLYHHSILLKWRKT